MAKRKSNVAKCKVWTDSAVMELEGSIVGVAREMGMTLDIDGLALAIHRRQARLFPPP